MADQFTIGYDIERARLHLRGELDLTVATQLTKSLKTYDGQHVVLDLTELTFIDSSGIRVLLAARRNHPRLRIVNVPASTGRVFDMVGVTDALLDGTDLLLDGER